MQTAQKQIVPVLYNGDRISAWAWDIKLVDSINWDYDDTVDYYEGYAIVCGEICEIWTTCPHNDNVVVGHSWHILWK